MKNLIKVSILLFLISMSSESFAQTTKGKFMVSGGTGLFFSSGETREVYDGETYDKTKRSTMSLIPSFGYFIMDDLAIGLTGSITNNSTKYEDDDKYSTTIALIMPTAVYYFSKEGSVRPLVQVGVGYTSINDKYIPDVGSDEKETYGGLAFNAGAGLAYFVADNISFNFGLSYTNSTYTNKDDTKQQFRSKLKK